MISHTVSSPLGKKHFMAKYKCFMLKESSKFCVWEYWPPSCSWCLGSLCPLLRLNVTQRLCGASQGLAKKC